MAHIDLDTLLNALLPLARKMLAKRGEIHPFGGSMDHEGKVSLTSLSEAESPDSPAMVDMLTAGFKQKAREHSIRAVAICFDSMVTPPGASEKVDAICVRLEHVSGENAVVFLPYKKGWFRRVKCGKLFSSRTESKVFEAPTGG